MIENRAVGTNGDIHRCKHASQGMKVEKNWGNEKRRKKEEEKNWGKKNWGKK